MAQMNIGLSKGGLARCLSDILDSYHHVPRSNRLSDT